MIGVRGAFYCMNKCSDQAFTIAWDIPQQNWELHKLQNIAQKMHLNLTPESDIVNGISWIFSEMYLQY